MELLIGCGHDKSRHIATNGQKDQGWQSLVTLDLSAYVKPQVICDLNQLNGAGLPFKDSSFDELHAYEVLEHVGKQGDWRFFFSQFDEFARVLKPQGLLAITTPGQSKWTWGDPGHVRYLGPEVFVFLLRSQYEAQKGKTSMTDYRPYFKSDWSFVFGETGEDGLSVVLKNEKE